MEGGVLFIAYWGKLNGSDFEMSNVSMSFKQESFISKVKIEISNSKGKYNHESVLKTIKLKELVLKAFP